MPNLIKYHQINWKKRPKPITKYIRDAMLVGFRKAIKKYCNVLTVSFASRLHPQMYTVQCSDLYLSSHLACNGFSNSAEHKIIISHTLCVPVFEMVCPL